MSMMQEFKEFAIKGNVVDMAVGVIIGTAFGKIVSSLVTDVVMPRLSGVQLAERLASVRDDMRVLFMSGYAQDGLSQSPPPPDAAFVQKPVTPPRLLAKVREVLGPS